MIFTSFKAKGHSEEYTSDRDYSPTDVSLSYGYLKLNKIVRYTIPLSAFSLFINAGLANSLVVSETNLRRKQTYFFADQGRITEDKAIQFVRKHKEALLFGFGGIVKKYSLEIRYESGNGCPVLTT